MPNDFKYNNGDRVLDAATNGNYETTPGQADMMIREMACWPMEIDGGEYGNRAYVDADRGSDTPEQREVIRRHFEAVGQRYVDAGGISELSVTVDDPEASDGLAVHVVCYDIMRGQEVDTHLPVVLLD